MVLWLRDGDSAMTRVLRMRRCDRCGRPEFDPTSGDHVLPLFEGRMTVTGCDISYVPWAGLCCVTCLCQRYLSDPSRDEDAVVCTRYVPVDLDSFTLVDREHVKILCSTWHTPPSLVDLCTLRCRLLCEGFWYDKWLWHALVPSHFMAAVWTRVHGPYEDGAPDAMSDGYYLVDACSCLLETPGDEYAGRRYGDGWKRPLCLSTRILCATDDDLHRASHQDVCLLSRWSEGKPL